MTPSAPIIPVLPYLAVAVLSLSLAVSLNAALSTATALRGELIFPSALDDVLTHLMIYGFVLPIALALSIRNLPLFMRLAFPPNQALFPILISYVAGIALRLSRLFRTPVRIRFRSHLSAGRAGRNSGKRSAPRVHLAARRLASPQDNRGLPVGLLPRRTILRRADRRARTIQTTASSAISNGSSSPRTRGSRLPVSLRSSTGSPGSWVTLLCSTLTSSGTR